MVTNGAVSRYRTRPTTRVATTGYLIHTTTRQQAGLPVAVAVALVVYELVQGALIDNRTARSAATEKGRQTQWQQEGNKLRLVFISVFVCCKISEEQDQWLRG